MVKKYVTINQQKITRVEVITESGRAYVKHNSDINLSIQDDGKTLKIFISKVKK